MAHQCAAADCATQIALDKLVCGRHWKRIPRHLQRRLYAAWNDGDITPDYDDACGAAIAAAEKAP